MYLTFFFLLLLYNNERNILMKNLILIICMVSLVGCSTTPTYNKYAISPNDLDIINNEIVFKNDIYTMTNTKTSTTREITKVPIYQLTADSVQYSYNGPLHNECKATVVIPQFNTSASFFNPMIYTTGKNEILATRVKFVDLKNLYSALYHNDINNAKQYALKIFQDTNVDYCRVLLYGKDKHNRNVGYLYIPGKENTGIVFFYPDKFNGLFNNAWKRPTKLGWDKFINKFISIIKGYNNHINFKHLIKNNDEFIILTYK